MADFAVQPLREVAAKLESSKLEKVWILADRSDFESPYVYYCPIPEKGDEQRSLGLKVLFARGATIAAAIVGTSTLRVVCEEEDTLTSLLALFAEHPALAENLAQFGPLQITREDSTEKVGELLQLPFGTRSVPAPISHHLAAEQQVFVGVDYGRSDIKVAVLDITGQLVGKYVTRWWMTAESGEVTYVDPQVLTCHKMHINNLAEAAMAALAEVPSCDTKYVCGLGLSAAGCVKNGKLCGIPPAMDGVNHEAAEQDLQVLEKKVLSSIHERCAVDKDCVTALVNDGEASALYGADGLAQGRVGLFLSCGTGLAGGIVWNGQCSEGVLELGKLVMGLRNSESGMVPVHDSLLVEAAAQGMAGTQRSFFNLLAARGGEVITGKAEQRAALVSMQKNDVDESSRGVFESLGKWLARFVLELNHYLPAPVDYVEAGGKVTDGPTGRIMLDACQAELWAQGATAEVCKAADSEFGQAIAVANLVRPAEL